MPVCRDSLVKGDETFLLRLSNPQGASVADGVARGFIRDND